MILRGKSVDFMIALVCVLILVSVSSVPILDLPTNAKDFRSQSLIPAINKVWVVNLVYRKNRMEFMDRQLRELKIPYERWDAFDFGGGNETKTEVTLKRVDPFSKMNIEQVRADMKVATDQTWGAVGCWQSHLHIYIDILQGKAATLPGPFLILEDDVKIDPSISHFLSYEYLFETLPSDWEMLYLDHIGLKCHANANASAPASPSSNTLRGTNTPSSKPVNSPNTSLSDFCAVDFTYGTGGYVVRNREVAEKLLAAGNTPGLQVADKYINPLFHMEKIKAYAILSKPIEQMPEEFGSDIRSARALKFTIAKFYSTSKKNRTHHLRG